MAARIRYETVYPDGGYVAEVHAYGVIYAAHYVAGEIRLHKTGGHRLYGWKRNGARKAAEKAVAERLKELGPEFEAAHRKLYAEELAA